MSYQYGQEIQVGLKEGEWFRTPTIYIGPGRSGGVICVHTDNIESFREGCDFTTTLWLYHRPLPQKKIVPWGPKDVRPGMAVREKSQMEGVWSLILGVGIDGVVIAIRGELRFVNYETLECEYVQLDGTPCGKEVEG